MIQAFRRPQSATETVRLKLRGLEAGATYAVSDVDGGAARAIPGRELMGPGIAVTRLSHLSRLYRIVGKQVNFSPCTCQ